jgi:hypothetical protein
LTVAADHDVVWRLAFQIGDQRRSVGAMDQRRAAS